MGDLLPGHQMLPAPRIILLTAAVMLALVALCACSGEARNGIDETASPEAMTVNDTQSAQSVADQKLNAQVAQMLSEMTLEQKVAQLFIVDPEQLVGGGEGTVTQVDDATKAALQEKPVGGIIFFAKNLEDADQTTTMMADFQSCAQESQGLPLFLCVDEEGGTVSRVASNPAMGTTDVGDMSIVGATGDVQNAADVGTTLGTQLTALGFNVDFAPDTDVLDPTLSSIMEQRSFSTDPQVVADMSTAQIKAMSSEGLLSCAKHFPGHGSVAGDSHENEVVSQKTLDQLKQSDLIPFEAAVKADVPFIMVGHISCPQVTGDNTPASLSKQMITDELRNGMGYEGLIITDSMGMGAINEFHSPDEAAVLALQAGNDIILHTPDYATACAGVVAAVENGEISEQRIGESVTRVLKTKMTLL